MVKQVKLLPTTHKRLKTYAVEQELPSMNAAIENLLQKEDHVHG
jgi:hypothetical protein